MEQRHREHELLVRRRRPTPPGVVPVEPPPSSPIATETSWPATATSMSCFHHGCVAPAGVAAPTRPRTSAATTVARRSRRRGTGGGYASGGGGSGSRGRCVPPQRSVSSPFPEPTAAGTSRRMTTIDRTRLAELMERERASSGAARRQPRALRGRSRLAPVRRADELDGPLARRPSRLRGGRRGAGSPTSTGTTSSTSASATPGGWRGIRRRPRSRRSPGKRLAGSR